MESTSFDKNHQMGFKMVHSNIKTHNLALVNLQWVTWAQPIPLLVWSTCVVYAFFFLGAKMGKGWGLRGKLN